MSKNGKAPSDVSKAGKTPKKKKEKRLNVSKTGKKLDVSKAGEMPEKKKKRRDVSKTGKELDVSKKAGERPEKKKKMIARPGRSAPRRGPGA